MVINSDGKKQIQILILGGGFAGINALLGLEKRFAHNPAVEMTLISRENFFLFTPMLAEVAIGAVDPRHIVTPIRELCRKTQFYRGEVVGIDLNRQQVEVCINLVSGQMMTFAYDHLVLAMGSTSNMMLVPGVDKYAFNFKEIGDAIWLRNHILEMFERANMVENPSQRQAMLTFCIIGGGYSGVEIAAAIQEMALRIQPLYPAIRPEDIRVLVVEAQERILHTLPVELSNYAHRQLEDMGVEVVVNTRLTEVHPRWMEIEPGGQIPTYTVVWATGITIPPILRTLPVTKDNKNRPVSTPELRLPNFTNVWAVGDNVLTPIPGKEAFYTATAQVAIRQGHHVAENIDNFLNNKALKPFSYKQKGEMVVLGERSAVALVYGIKLRGFIAWLLWRLFYLSRLPRGKKKIRVAIDWLLNLFGPMETTQLKLYARQEPCDLEEAICFRENLSPRQREAL